MDVLLGLLEEIGSARGRRPRPEGAELEILRELKAEDLPLILNPPVVAVETPAVKRLTQRHHTLARLISEGRSAVECNAITGHSLSRISILKGDPAFKELLDYYARQTAEVFINVHERRAALGEAAINELHERIEESPEGFSNKELRELAGTMLDGAPKVAGGMREGGGTTINVNFVGGGPTGGPQGDQNFIDVTPGRQEGGV